MEATSGTKLFGEDVDVNEATLHIYLKDPTFVEYFNSFLLLPAFSKQLYFNSETGYFEPVHGGGVVAWGGDGGILTPSSSVATLYLTDETIGPSLDKQQSWSWVVQHRLSLFKKSDLYSEYKLCKLLTTPEVSESKSCISLPLKSRRSNSTGKPLPSPTSPKPPLHPKKRNSFDDTIDVDTLPPLPLSPSPPKTSFSGDSSQQLLFPPKSPVSPPKSPVSSPRLSPRLTKSQSVVAFGNGPSRMKLQRTLSHNVTKTSRAKLSTEDLQLIGSKSGMYALWRFLRGKAGEKNWLFWLDAERLKCYPKPNDHKKLLKEIRERYLLPGSPHKLPAETRDQIKVYKTTLALVQELQMSLAEGIKDYWLPRFLLHYRNNMDEFATNPLHPPSYSAPEPLQLDCPNSPLQEDSSLMPNYPRVTTPFTPSATPTFRRLKTSNQLPRTPSEVFKNDHKQPENRKSFRAPTYHAGFGGGTPSPLNTRSHVSFKQVEHVRPHTVGGSLSSLPQSPSKMLPIKGYSSRKVWDRGSMLGEEDGDTSDTGRGRVIRKDSRKVMSAVNLTQIQAKYTSQRLPDPGCRCASSMDYNPYQDGMCESHCQILSVAGTPVPPPLLQAATHSHTHQQPIPNRSLYQSLIVCLNIEHRKAGGYFQDYLEELEDKAYLHCLFFWQDLQEYKALFFSKYFSPCAVEMKAKELFGRYIAVGCIEFIGCSSHIVNMVSSSLWPAYEDLFDVAEEHSLGMLLVQWIELCAFEEQIFQNLNTASESGRSSRHGINVDTVALHDLDEEDEEMLCCDGEVGFDASEALQRPKSSSPSKLHSRPLSRARAGLTTPTVTGRSATPSSLRSSTSQLQGHTPHAISLNDIMKNRSELEYFKIFLNEHFAAQDLMCWMEIEAFRGIPVSNKAMRDLRAKQLRSRYLNKKYFFGSHSPANKEQQRQVVQAGGGGYGSHLPARPGTPVFREAQKHVRRRLEKKWLAEFVSSPDFLSRNGGGLVEHRKSGTKTSNVTNTYEKSFANSHEAILLRKILQDKTQCDLFQKYLMIEVMGGTSSNVSHSKRDIEFWIEVQRYKEMCHAHTTDVMLQNKVKAIIDCYIQSSSLPRLQIDVPSSIADHVARKSQGPYIFREAQAIVFKHLASCWESYQNFINGLSEHEIAVALNKMERQLQNALVVNKERQEQRKSEMEQIQNAVPRFETQAEKEERLKKEKEESEFGHVAIAFSLTAPNPGYTYFTELPEDEQVATAGQEPPTANAQSNQSNSNPPQPPPPSSKRQATKEQEVQPTVTTMKARPNSNWAKDKRDSRGRIGSEISILSMTLNGDNYTAKPYRRQASATIDHSAVAGANTATVGSNQQPLLLEPQKSAKYFFHNKKGASRLTKKETIKNMRTAIAMNKFAPHSTINMRRSGVNGTPYVYGSGLPEEQISHLSIIHATT